MITARRAALLGLTAPLSAIMIAVLGLWPEAEESEVDDLFPPPADAKGGGDGKPARSAAAIAREKQEAAEAETAILERNISFRQAQNMAAINAVLAFVTEEEFA